MWPLLPDRHDSATENSSAALAKALQLQIGLRADAAGRQHFGVGNCFHHCCCCVGRRSQTHALTAVADIVANYAAIGAAAADINSR